MPSRTSAVWSPSSPATPVVTSPGRPSSATAAASWACDVSTWLPDVHIADGGSEFDAVFALRPDLFDAYRDFESVFWTHELLDPEILDACRARCAQVLRATGAPAEPVTADDPTSAL